MTNPLLKVTLILLSLISAVIVGQVLLNSAQTSPLAADTLAVTVVAPQKSGFALSAAPITSAAEQSSGRATDKTLPDAATQHVSSNSIQDKRRSFSFHYLDVLEWMFAGRGEKAKQHQRQRPSTTFTAR